MVRWLPVAAVLALLWSAGMAQGHVVTTPTGVKIFQINASGANGGVGSTKSACIKGRTVQLLKGAAKSKVATAVSNASGRWTITKTLEPDVYYARVTRKNVHFRKRGKLHKHDCGGATSQVAGFG
jgi:hypothetical protein